VSALRLVIGNKNYSSWSLRAWLVLAQAEIPFEEIKLRLFVPGYKAEIAKYSPAGRVPVLLDGELTIWDTLAIAEYLAERFPERALWPADARRRARARSICAEMHSGFATLRSQMPMNVGAELKGHGWNVAVQRDIDRICDIWRACRAESGGPLLFGAFTIADAFFAPVTARFVTYGVALPADARAYVDAIWALPAMRRWVADARAENDFLDEDEPYRLRAQ
jgi:glutathione S-transferase